MPSFKPKTSKIIKMNRKTAITIDGKHKEFLNEFIKDETDIIPELKMEKISLNQQLIEQAETLTIEEKLDIVDRINEIIKTIKDIKHKKKDYFLNNSKYVFDYFENKKNISTGQTKTHIDKIENTNKNNLLKSFFKIKEDSKKKEDEKKDIEDQYVKGPDKFPLSPGRWGYLPPQIQEDEKSEYLNKNNNIVQKYLSNIDETFLDVNSFVFQTDICKICHEGELIPLEDEGVLICNKCSRIIPYLIENEKPSYKEPPKEVCFYAYKRINHFKEILAQFQGKETTQIPQEVIENIKLQIKKERIDINQISNLKTKEILKNLGYNKYYEHIPFIKDKLGIKPPVMSPELEETLCNLFIELQSPYSKYCPDDRVNFLNYYYTAYKLCELLGEVSYLPLFPLLKDKEKRIEQDAIWKKICEELDWEFINTV